MFERMEMEEDWPDLFPVTDTPPPPQLSGAGCGLVDGALIATENGWLPIEDLRPGMQVLTFDSGLQTVLAVVRDELWNGVGRCPPELWPLQVAAGAVGNRFDMLVMPNQGVLIESDAITDAWGDPFALVPGAALDVLEGVERHEPYGTVEVFQPVFESDQIVFSDHGALMLCPSHWGEAHGILPRHHGHRSPYSLLSRPVAERILNLSHVNDMTFGAQAVA